MKTGVLFTGGKDSCLALYKYGKEKIDCLLTIVPENKDSWMFHKPNLKLLRKQAGMLEMPLILEKTKGKKEKELKDLKKLIKKSRVNKIITGGIASNYQAKRIKRICGELGVEVIAPLWHRDSEELWKELFDNDFKIIITKIACEGLEKEWLGKMINRENFQELKSLAERYKFNLSGEGGEFETLVLDCPLFSKKLRITEGKVVWERNSGYYIVTKIRVLNKEK
jgi:ABC transporter with metal-binding/Fe-S-binding domain ATP-binding protein